MPLFLLLVGAVFLITSIRGTHRELGDLLKSQFVGPGSFTAWLVAILMIAALGTIEQLRPLARAFLVLLLITLFLVNSREQNIFALISAQLVGRGILRNAAPTIERNIP